MKSLVYGSKRADDMVIEMQSADANNELILFLSKVHNIFDDTSWHASAGNKRGPCRNNGSSPTSVVFLIW
jgi:hypothetical protein